MSAVHRFELVLVLMAAVLPLELLARRLRLPPAAALILGGIALALLPGMPEVDLDPDLALVLFLPPLLQASAYATAWRDFRANLRIILQLAVGAVVFTTLVVGWVTHLVLPHLPWAACFALGAILSPPDAVAAKAVLAGLPLPRRVVVLLEGESLVNDASGLVLYRFAVVAALTGAFSFWDAAGQFAWLAAGGVAVGVVAGLLVTAVLGRLHDAQLAVVGSFLSAWASYILAERLGASGVLSTVACGLVMGGRQHSRITAATRTSAMAVWQVVEFVLESFVFILIGLSLRGVLTRLEASTADGAWAAIVEYLPDTAAVVAAVVLSRFVWLIPSNYVPRFLLPSLRARDPYPPLAVPVVMGWAGMRGVVSLAAALALPADFPGRDFILAATFATILVTVLVQGATLAPLIRALQLGTRGTGFQLEQAPTLGEAEARAQVVQAQQAAVERESLQADGTHRHPRLVEQYGFRARAAARYSEAAGGLAGARTEHFTVVLAAVAAGRAELLRLHRDGRIHDTVLHALEQELDLEEMSARRRVGEKG